MYLNRKLFENMPLIRVYKAYKAISRVGSYLYSYPLKITRYKAYKRVIRALYGCYTGILSQKKIESKESKLNRKSVKNIPLISDYKAYKKTFRVGSYGSSYPLKKSPYKRYKRVLGVSGRIT
jgi:hypothetical protein